MTIGYIITISIICGIVALLCFLHWLFSAMRKKLKNYIQRNFSEAEIVKLSTNVNFFGELSKGGRQIRGNGALVLTSSILTFIRAVPFKVYTIPTKSITQVSMPTSFNGKSILSPVLCIHYHINNKEDAIAWAIKDPQQWQEAIDNLITE